MKKIIALILALCCVFAFSSCDFVNGVIDSIFGGEEEVDGVAVFKELYSVSEPTRVETNYTISLGGFNLRGNSILATGALSDGSAATVLTYEYPVLQTVQAGAGTEITPITGEPLKGSREYVEGKGERIDGGAWDEYGMDFAPQAGSIAINVDASLVKNLVYNESGSTRTLSFTVPEANTSQVFGNDYEITSDANVVITANSAVVTGLSISYTEAIESEDEDIEYPIASITVTVDYSYGIEEITLVKK